MFALQLLLAVLQGIVLIGGHMVKSDVHHGFDSNAADQLLSSSVKIGPSGIATNVEDAAASNAASNQEFLRSIAFHPVSVDFGSWSIGTARSYLVTLINKNANKSVHLSSISGNTHEFYSSFFEDKVVPPQGNTTFNVVFLPRRHGLVETDLLIHTSFGQAKLPVRGEGKECPYRIKSLVGIRAPFNATITPEIYMYNPHSKPIQILEIYSSGGKFQLELPSGGQEGPQALWEIPPYTTKPIIRMKFHGTQPGNHTAFIRVKISESIAGEVERFESTLVIPVEIEIGEDSGLYSPNPILDFGTLTSSDTEKIFKIELSNSGKHTFEGMTYRVDNVGGLIELQDSDLTLHLHPNAATDDLNIDGFLTVEMWRHVPTSDNTNAKKHVQLTVGLRAKIYRGSLNFEKNRTVFITETKDYSRERQFPVQNGFGIPIAILNVTADDNDTKAFRISEFSPVTIAPGEIVNLFRVVALNDSANFQTNLRIETNISTYVVPLIICSGIVTRYTSLDAVNLTPLPERSILNFGPIQYEDISPHGYVLIRNSNPVDVQILRWNFTNPHGVSYQMGFLGCSPMPEASGFSDSLDYQTNIAPIQKRFKFCEYIRPNEVAAFQLSVMSRWVKSYSAVLQVWTEFEAIETAVSFEVVMGRLEVDQSRLHFSECFPGKRCSADILIHSTFVKPMQVNSITVSVPGLVFEYHTQEGLPEIVANSITDIGRIHFDPKSVCGKHCYILADNTAVGDLKNLQFDEMELRRRTELFRRFKYNLQMITFTLNTSEVRLFEFNATVDIVWPKLIRGHQILSTIEIGQNYDAQIPIENPSSNDIQVEIGIADPRQAKTTSLSLPLEVVNNCAYCYLTDKDVFVLGNGNDQKLTLNIPPGSVAKIPIKFLGNVAGQFSTIIHVFNNLTLYEAVWITAKALQSQFRFGNRRPGSTTPLLFEINERNLVSCYQPSQDGSIPSVKRTFTARNTGEVPILVEEFLIGDSPCEGYGFKIVDCANFELKANSSKKIDIAFTPDFTMTRITQSLTIMTNLSTGVNYTLVATVPASSLEQCSRFLPRPLWEAYMKKMSVGVLAVAFVFVLVAICFDSEKILKDHVDEMSREKGPMQPPLDLRHIGMRSSPSDDQITNGISSLSAEKANKVSNAQTTARKRNVKRNSVATPPSPPTVVNNGSKEKSWAEELAKNIRTVSYTAAATSASSKVLSKAIQTVTPAVATIMPKPTKEEKPIHSSKRTASKDQTENSKPASEKNSSDKKSDKSDSSPPAQTESKKPRMLFKKTKPASPDSPPKTVETINTSPTEKPPQEKSNNRPAKSSPKEKIEPESKNRNETVSFVTPKRDSPTGSNADAVTTATPRGKSERKFGKTPGRERKKDQPAQSNSSSASKRRVPKFKGTAFQFTSPLPTTTSSSSNTTAASSLPITPSSPKTSPNVWDITQATTFSNIVAQKPGGAQKPAENESAAPIFTATSYGGAAKTLNFDETNQDNNNNTNAATTGAIHEWNEADLKNHETFGNDSEIKLPVGNSGDLGPIGTKKSPSSTPLWGSFLDNIQRPSPHFSQQPPSNTSFFSSNFPIAANLDYSNNQFLGGTSNLLEHIFSENQHFDHIPANDLLMSWLQRERIRQQQANWSGNRTWTPMGYQDDPMPSQTAATGDQMAVNNLWQAASVGNGTVGGVVRPPPGLPIRSNHDSPIQQQPTPQQQQQQSQLPSQLPPQSDLNMPNPAIDQLPPYDPYTSFTSIWSDPWNKTEKK